MGKFRQVEKGEYDDFVANYPRPLMFNVHQTFEPPMGAHHDFSDGKLYPDSVVAYRVMGGKPELFYVRAEEQ